MPFGSTIITTVLGGPSTPADTNPGANSIAEGAAVNTSIGVTAHSTSPSSSTITYSLSADSSGGGFKIDPVTGVVTVADPSKIDFESAPGHAYTITTRASDANSSSTQTFTISVADVAPSTPVDSNAAANTVLEGAANGTAVGITASSTDVNGPAVTWSLIGDTSGGGFTINATTGVVTVADGSKIDFESAAGHAYTVTVQSSDGTLTSSQAFTINVGDVSMTTPVDNNGAANTVAEGAAAGTTVGITASASDPSGPATTYSLIGDTSGGGFTINASTGVVTVANPAKIDFESTAPGHTYNITVQASNGVQTTSQVFTVGVTDVAPSAPTDSNGAANTVVEGAANGTVVGVTASSADVNGGAVTYSLTGDTSGGGFTINATTGVVTVADSTKINYETAPGHAYTVTAQASDGTLTNSQTFTIAVSDVAPSAPVDSNGATNTVAEGAANGSTVGLTAFSTDINGPGVTYSLVGDTSGGGFTINATTGVVTVADSTKLDYETTPGHAYTVTAQASDGTFTNSQTFTIALTDVAPSAPTDTNGAANTVAEGAANGSTVGITASSLDPNGPATTYSLSDSAGGRFAIDSSTGIVTVANGAAIDFETAAGHAYGITVLATNGALSTSSAFSIGVTDVGPSAPTDTNGAAESVFEGAANGTVVGITASSTDPGGGPAPTYTLTDNAGGRFAIDANTGIVTVANGAAIDFETAPGHAYGITVQATAGALASTQNFSIGVGNVNEAPAGTDNAASIAEDTTYTFGVADFGFTDPSDSSAPNSLQAVKMTTVPGAGTGTFTNNGNPVNAGDFISATDIAAGHLVFTPTANANGSPEATFTFQVQDNGGTANGGVDLDQSPNTFTLNVTSVNDAPAGTDKTIAGAGPHTFAASEFGFTDPVDAGSAAGANAFQAVIITTLPDAGTGTLELNGVAVTAGQSITVGDIGGLVFTPVGNNTGTFTFQVQDNGGTANGGVDTDQSPNTFSILQDVAPVVTAGGTLNYTENQAATAIDPAVTVTDSDSPNLAHATVQITGNYFNGQDVLSFVNTASITGSFDTASGTLTLSGSDTVAHYQTALESVKYVNTSDDPSGAARTVTIIANDGTLDSAPVTDTINVTPVNDAPATTAGGTLNYTENQAATVIDASVTVSDVDNANMISAAVQIGTGFASGQDVLSANVAGTSITASYDGGTGALSLSGSDTKAHYQQVLDSVAYFNSSENPSGADRTVSYTVNDGALNSNTSTSTIHVTPVNDAPVTTAGGTLNYTENQAPTVIDAGVTVSDVDNANMFSATVQIGSGFASGQDVLSANTVGTSITASYNGGTGLLTLSSSDTKAHYQQVLDSVAYSNSSDNPSGADRIVSYTVNDGALNSNTSTATVHVTPVNDPPVNVKPATQTTLEDTSLTFSTGNGNAVSVGDVDVQSGNLQVNLGVSHGVLTLSGTAGLTVTGNGTDTVQVTGTPANINAALNGLVYAPAANFNGSAADTLTITTSDLGNTGTGGAQSDTDTVTINITPVNDAPSFTVGANQPVTEDSGAHSVTNFATGLSAGPANESGQTLNFIVSNNNGAMFLVAPSISPTGTLTYTTAANYSGTATVSVQIHDDGGTANGGVDTSAVQTFIIDASPLADTPTFTTALTPTAGNEFQANTTTSHTGQIGFSGPVFTFIQQNDAVVSALPGGGFVVAWDDVSTEVDPDDVETIRARIYNSSGTAVGNDILLTDPNAGDVRHVTVNGLPVSGTFPSGAFLVTFQTTSLSGPDAGLTVLHGRIFNASTGALIGSEFRIDQDDTTQEQTLPSATVFSDGSFIVAWEDVPNTGASEIWAQRYNAAGQAVALNGSTLGLANFQVADGGAGTNNLGSPDVTDLTNGNFVVTWTADEGDGAGNQATFYRVYSSTGTTVHAAAEVNSTTANSQAFSVVTALKGGGFAIAWQSQNQVSGSSNFDIYVRLFDASGNAVTAGTAGEILVNTTTTGVQESPAIVALPDGGFLVEWNTDQDTGSTEGVFAQRFDSSGNKVGGQFEINQTTTGSQTISAAGQSNHPTTVLDSGQVVTVWDGSPGDGADIFGRIFTVPGDGPENSTGIGLGAISALVTDLVGTTSTNGGHEIIDHLTLSGFPAGFTFSLGHASGGNWVIDQAADITAIASSATQLKIIPTAGYHSFFTLDVTATVTDMAHLSSGDVTSAPITTTALHIPIGVKAPGDPIFAADSAAPFDLSLDPVADGDTVSITSLPGNGQIEYADGSPVAAGAVLTAAQFALLKFAPSDLGADTAAGFEYSVSDGTSQTLNTVPINLVHGTGLTIDGSVSNDHVIGSPGNDILNGGPGHDILTGGAGADHFVFDHTALADATAAAPQIDNVTDYSAAQGDVLDLTALFSGAAVASLSLSSLVHATEDASGTFATLQVNTAATGQAAQWVDIAQLDGVREGDAIKVSIDPGHPAVSAQIQSAAEQAQAGAPTGGLIVIDNFMFTPPVQPAVSPPPPVETIAGRVFGAIGGFDFFLRGQAAPAVHHAGEALTLSIVTGDAPIISYSSDTGGPFILLGGNPAGSSGTPFGEPMTDTHIIQNHVDLHGWII